MQAHNAIKCPCLWEAPTAKLTQQSTRLCGWNTSHPQKEIALKFSANVTCERILFLCERKRSLQRIRQHLSLQPSPGYLCSTVQCTYMYMFVYISTHHTATINPLPFSFDFAVCDMWRPTCNSINVAFISLARKQNCSSGKHQNKHPKWTEFYGASTLLRMHMKAVNYGCQISIAEFSNLVNRLLKAIL